MSKLTFFLKHNLNKVPVGLKSGTLISKLNYKYRPGIAESYKKSEVEINGFYSGNLDKKVFVFNKVKSIVEHAFYNVPFYTEYYNKSKFKVDSLLKFDDLNRIPVVCKDDFKKFDLEHYSYFEKGRSISNTGGSTGSPFYFYTSPSAVGHEWAHIHHFWKIYGFAQSDLKINFVGRSNVSDLVEYDFVRHSLIVDIYADLTLVTEKLTKFLLSYSGSKIFLHGYPSAIYEFAKSCQNSSLFLKLLQDKLVAIFLCSEMPTDHFRNKIESTFDVPTQAFYGHTERCVIASESTKRNKYDVYQTYGFAESLNGNLVGTSYNGFATPLIRYDTKDKISNELYEGKLLSSFSITEGREGEYVVDKYGKKIPVTAVIFGRHHKLFNFVDSIQLHQASAGSALVLYSASLDLPLDEAKNMFDSSNIEIEFSFKRISQPIRTKSGKVNFVVKDI